jgi:hypothetical protein
VACQAVKETLLAGTGRAWPVHYYNVQADQVSLVQAKRFTDDTLQAVSADRQTTVLFCYGQTETSEFLSVAAIKHRKECVTATCGVRENPTEGCLARQALRTPEPEFIARRLGLGLVSRDSDRGLRRELCAAFGTTALQYKATGLRCHARAEAVSTCPLQCAGLERAFHVPYTCLLAGADNPRPK